MSKKKKNRFLIISSFGLIVVVLIIIMVGQNVNTQTREEEPPEYPNFGDPIATPTPSGEIVNSDIYKAIDEKALIAKNLQPQAIGELVDTIFASYGVVASGSSLASALRDRIVRAELNRLKITELQLTNTVNWLADEISAPEYAKTSSLQIRALRLGSNNIMPNLFPEEGGKEKLSTTPTRMSVCEAVCLLSDTLFQKQYNPYFQKNPDQWDAEFNNLMQSNEQVSEEVSMIFEPQTEDFRNLNQSNIESTAHATLDRLGIQR